MLDSAYDRNQMQTLFAMLANTRVQGQVMLPKAKRKHVRSTAAVANWWRNLKARVAHRHAPQAAKDFPQRAASPRMSRDAARWQAPTPSASAGFFAVLDDMGARHQAAARRDHLIKALEAYIRERP